MKQADSLRDVVLGPTAETPARSAPGARGDWWLRLPELARRGLGARRRRLTRAQRDRLASFAAEGLPGGPGA
eukprot:7921196-Alexandrium_andersonii.AAC.1